MESEDKVVAIALVSLFVLVSAGVTASAWSDSERLRRRSAAFSACVQQQIPLAACVAAAQEAVP